MCCPYIILEFECVSAPRRGGDVGKKSSYRESLGFFLALYGWRERYVNFYSDDSC